MFKLGMSKNLTTGEVTVVRMEVGCPDKGMIFSSLKDYDIEAFRLDLKKWREGEFIQVAMPYLTADEREFIMTGITPEEWDATFGEPEGEDE